MLYYLGKGTEFKKEECKEYKTFKNALAAAEKNEALTVWDENGVIVGGSKEGRTENEPSESENGKTEADTTAETGENDRGQQGNKQESTGEDTETVENSGEDDKAENEPSELGNGENGANTMTETGEDGRGQQDSIIIPQGTMKVTVVCDGALNIRRSPAWGNENICGRAVRGQSYYVKEIRTVDGKEMVRTIDDLYLSGLSEHVQFEQL